MQSARQTAIARLAVLAALGLAAGLPAQAQTYTDVTVNATNSIEAAGQTSLPSGATYPTAYAITSGGTLTFSSVTGSITLNNSNYNDADGVGSVSNSTTNAANGISSISHTSKAGFLVGLFTGPTAPSGAAPAGLTFSDTGAGGTIATNFTALSPLLDQTFFIGDGLTGDGTGATQQFFAPAGATQLYLGFADAPGYNGNPGSYGDNAGSLKASFTVTPEPSEVASLGIGLFSIIALGLRARARRAA